MSLPVVLQLQHSGRAKPSLQVAHGPPRNPERQFILQYTVGLSNDELACYVVENVMQLCYKINRLQYR